MYGSKNDQRGSGDDKKRGRPKNTSSSHGSPKKSGYSNEKVDTPFQPVLLRPQEPRAKPSKNESSQLSNVGSQPALTEKSAPIILHKPSSSTTPAPSINLQPESLLSFAKQPQRSERRTGGHPQAVADSASPSKASVSPNRSKPSDIKAQESVSSEEPRKSPAALSSNLFRLVGESNQYQSLLSDEIKSFLDVATEMFPASSSGPNLGEVTVIGVMGGANTGKSTLLNAIASKCIPVFNAAPTSAGTSLGSSSNSSSMSILAELRQWRDNHSSDRTSASSFAPFTVNTISTASKSHTTPNKSSFSVEMSLVKRIGGSRDPLEQNAVSSRTNPSDCIILLEATCTPSASMMVHAKKAEQALASDVRTQENLLQMTSLQIGLFMLSVCNVVVFVDESTCRVSSWKYLKTLEMMKWNIPEMSELFYSSPVMNVLIQQRHKSFADARQRETYERMMLDMVSRASGESSTKMTSLDNSTNVTSEELPMKKTKQGGKRQRKQRKQREAVNTVTIAASELTIDEQKVNALSGALDAIHLYSPDQEYLPALFFAFNKVPSSCTSAQHAQRVSKSLRAFFDGSLFLRPTDLETGGAKMAVGVRLVGSQLSSYSTHASNREDTGLPSKRRTTELPSSSTPTSIPFISIATHPGGKPGSDSATLASTVGEAFGASLETFSKSILALPSPRFKKSLNPVEWLIAANWMWDLIKHSPSLAQYNTVLKVGASRSVSVSTAASST